MTLDKADLFWDYWTMLAEAELPVPVREFRFHEKRKWRFDFAWPDRKIALEIEGNAWNVQGGGRHMQDTDLEKYNNAALLGWRILRFSPGMLRRDPLACIDTIRKVL